MGGVILAASIAILIVFVFLSYAKDQLELAKKINSTSNNVIRLWASRIYR